MIASVGILLGKLEFEGGLVFYAMSLILLVLGLRGPGKREIDGRGT